MSAGSERGLVVVIGSLNVDTIVRVDRLPGPGQTVIGGDARRSFGGKGGNQAVAAARAGARVEMIGAVGTDPDGDASLQALRDEGIGVAGVAHADRPTGAAFIAVEPAGENQIVVAPGANAALGEDVAARIGNEAGVLLVSLEVPLPAVTAAMLAAAHRGWTLVLNPAPVPPAGLPGELCSLRPILVPNRSEALALTRTDALEEAVAALQAMGLTRLAVTLGADGALLVDAGEHSYTSAANVRTVDTTGAGDTFCGVLAAWLAGGASLLEATAAANAAAGMSVAHPGARSGPPGRKDILGALDG